MLRLDCSSYFFKIKYIIIFLPNEAIKYIACALLTSLWFSVYCAAIYFGKYAFRFGRQFITIECQLEPVKGSIGNA